MIKLTIANLKKKTTIINKTHTQKKKNVYICNIKNTTNLCIKILLFL